jgi:hypothetical protein
MWLVDSSHEEGCQGKYTHSYGVIRLDHLANLFPKLPPLRTTSRQAG